ncbi:hypothetical protein ONZ45_g9960 [Pleurotus djamor]|nr:hypothetical protein ONZ45_g9960 [Pleurotus djamor]
MSVPDANPVKMEYDPKGMPFRRLGPSGLRVPLFSLGGWLTYGGTVNGDPVKEIIKTAFENGINMFDTAETYAKGKSEEEMGRVIKELGFRRSDIIVTTKIFWGVRPGPNAAGLSLPMEEVVRAFNFVIDKGWAFYWGTSEWDAEEIEEAYRAFSSLVRPPKLQSEDDADLFCPLVLDVADKLGLIAPIAEQCQHHMFHRERPEKEYKQLYKKYGYATTVWSALNGGVLTGKYNNGIPAGSRFDTNSAFFKDTISKLQGPEGEDKLKKVRALTELAEKELGCSIASLALAFIARSPNTSTVILGATKPEQILDNLKALEVIPKLTPEVLEKIEAILGNKPADHPTYGRPQLDIFGRL